MKTPGKYLMLFVNGQTIALATSCSLNSNAKLNDARTKDDPTGPANEFDGIEWTLSSENMVGVDPAGVAMTHASLMRLHLQGALVDVRFSMASPDGTNVASGAQPDEGWTQYPSQKAENDYGVTAFGGKAYIESVQLNAPVEGKATMTVNLKGEGDLKELQE